jgi:LmbE family N-acetylglucosaminyl deacetylase
MVMDIPGTPPGLPGAGETLLVFAPHPDDECLAAVGLMQRALRAGAAVHVCVVTDGENAPWIQRAYEKRWRIGPRERERFGRIRREEALRGLAEVGVSEQAVHFLHWPDQGLTALLLAASEEPVERLAALLAELRPARMIAPSCADLHPDHSALALLLELACATLAPGARPRRLTYRIHRRRAAPAPTCSTLELKDPERVVKRRALACHRTQLTVHRRRMLAFQSAVEEFSATAASPADHAGHAVAAAAWHAGELRLQLQLRARLGSHGPAELLLLGARAGRERWCARVALRHGEDQPPLRDARTGAEWGRARAERSESGWELRIPAVVLPQASSLHAKLERARGFFDPSGWIEVPAEPPTVGEVNGRTFVLL